MRKSINTMKRTAVTILAAAMIMSSANVPGALAGSPAVVNAAEADGDGGLLGNDPDLHTDTSADQETNNDKTNPGEFEDGDPYIYTSLFDLYDSDRLFASSDKIKLESLADGGIHVSGKNKDMQTGYVTLGRMYDFGDSSAATMRIDAISKRGKKVIAKFFLDEETTPFAEVQLAMQKVKDDWSQDGSKLISLPTGVPSGKHYVSVQFYDPDTEMDKKTEVLFREIQFFKKTGLPVIDINIDESYAPITDMNNDKNHMTECYGKINISVPDDFKSEYSEEGMTDYKGGEYKLDYIRGRGNSTWWADKKPYKIKLDEDANLFGMGTNKHWTLLANYYDNSLLRNRITYYLGEKLGMEYTPQLVPVEVNMNGNYIGSYYLCEQVRVGNSRVDIDDLENIKSDDENITGGYLLGTEPYGNEEGYAFNTTRGSRFVVESPEEISSKKVSSSKLDEMNSYIEDYMNKTEDAIYGEGFKDSEGKSYTDYMDLDSAAKYYLIQEFTQNGDGFISPSTKLYKKRDGKLYWGPLWDFDYVAWASTDYSDYDTNEAAYSGFYYQSAWFRRLLKDKQFTDKLSEVWGGKNSTDPNTLAYQLNELIKDGGVLDQYEAQMTISAENNFAKWGMTTFNYFNMIDENNIITDEDGTEITIPDSMIESGNYGPYLNPVSGQCETYAQEIARLKKWISKRIDWVDENLETTVPEGIKLTFVDDEGNVYKELGAFPNCPLDELPEEPKKDGYVFAGWYTKSQDFYADEDAEMKVSLGTYLYEACTIYPKWILESEVVPVEKIVPLEKEIYVIPGYLWSLSYSVVPANAIGSDVTIELSDPQKMMLISEENGFVVNSIGDYEIKLKAANGVEETIIVHAVDESMIYPFEVNFKPDVSKVELNPGEYQEIKFTSEGAGEGIIRVPMNFTIISVDPEIAEMTPGGVINAYKSGNTKAVILDNYTKRTTTIEIVVKGEPEENKNQESDKDKTTNDKTDVKSDTKSETKPSKEDAKTDSKTQEKTTEKAADKTTEATKKESVKKLAKGDTFNSGNLRYEVTKAGKEKNGKVTGGKVKVIGITTDSKKAKKITSISIPSTVTSENNKFTVTEITSKAFTGDEKIKNITIGKSVTKVGKCAFSDCEKLSKITIKGNNVKFNKKAFDGISKEAKAYVPGAKIKTYKKRLAKVGLNKNRIYKAKVAAKKNSKSKNKKEK